MWGKWERVWGKCAFGWKKVRTLGNIYIYILQSRPPTPPWTATRAVLQLQRRSASMPSAMIRDVAPLQIDICWPSCDWRCQLVQPGWCLVGWRWSRVHRLSPLRWDRATSWQVLVHSWSPSCPDSLDAAEAARGDGDGGGGSASVGLMPLLTTIWAARGNFSMSPVWPKGGAASVHACSSSRGTWVCCFLAVSDISWLKMQPSPSFPVFPLMSRFSLRCLCTE